MISTIGALGGRYRLTGADVYLNEEKFPKSRLKQRFALSYKGQ